MKALVRNAIGTDANILADVQSVNSVLSGQADTPSQRPFINLIWGPRTVGLPRTRADRQQLTVWVHDRGNDYNRINRILSRVRTVLEALEGVEDPEHGHVTAVLWTGDSAELTDTGHGTITRNSSLTIVGSDQD